MNEYKKNTKLGSAIGSISEQLEVVSSEREAEQKLPRDTLVRAICHHVFPETTRRLGSSDKYRNMVAVFSHSAIARSKQELFGKKPIEGSDLFQWLNSLEIHIGLKVEFLQIVARSLGDDWCDDSKGFIDVTIAMSRLQLILRKICQAELATAQNILLGQAIVVVPPGETHQFGQCIVEELFSTRGWGTELFVPENVEELIEHIVRANHDIVCLSWSSPKLMNIVEETISAIEKIEIAKRPAIIAGGAASLEDGKWMVNLGVKCVCDSAFSAMNIAEKMIGKTRAELLD